MRFIDKAKNAIKAFNQETRRTYDGLMNVFTKHSERNVLSRANNYYATDPILDYAQAENMYLSSWICKKVVEIPTAQVFKNGFMFKIHNNPELTERVLKLYGKIKIQDKIMEAMRDRDVYGGSVILIKNPVQDPLMPLDYSLLGAVPENIIFTEIDISYLAITPFTTITDPLYFKPKTIMAAGFSGDASNFILFPGIQVPTRRMPNFRFMGMSVFLNIYSALIQDDYVSQGVANSVWRGNRFYYKINGLNKMVEQANEGMALARLKLLEDGISIYGSGVIDTQDDIVQVSSNFAGLPEIDRRSLERLSAATNIPATILLGKSSDGLNATGQGDLEIFYNYIEECQQKVIEPIRKVFEILICMENNGKLEAFDFEFNKPNQVSQLNQVDMDTKTIANCKALEELGIPDEIIKSYMVKYSILSEEQATDLQLTKKDMLNTENIKLDPELEAELNSIELGSNTNELDAELQKELDGLNING